VLGIAAVLSGGGTDGSTIRTWLSHIDCSPSTTYGAAVDGNMTLGILSRCVVGGIEGCSARGLPRGGDRYSLGLV
jgi:hypothetical protein